MSREKEKSREGRVYRKELILVKRLGEEGAELHSCMYPGLGEKVWLWRRKNVEGKSRKGGRQKGKNLVGGLKGTEKGDAEEPGTTQVQLQVSVQGLPKHTVYFSTSFTVFYIQM